MRNRRGNERPIIPTLGRPCARIDISRDVWVLIRKGFDGIDATGSRNDIRAVEHIDHGKPMNAAIGRILHSTHAILVLFIQTMVRRIDVRFAAQIEVGRKEILDLVAFSIAGRAENKSSSRQICYSLSIHDIGGIEGQHSHVIAGRGMARVTEEV